MSRVFFKFLTQFYVVNDIITFFNVIVDIFFIRTSLIHVHILAFNNLKVFIPPGILAPGILAPGFLASGLPGEPPVGDIRPPTEPE